MDATISKATRGLLGRGDPAPYRVFEGSSPFLITCDHAGNQIPAVLGDLGLPADELARHIAWDIGAAGVARELGQRLDAFVILQTYSRLVIDCNRPLDQKSSITELSEATVIPGNVGLPPSEAERRADAVFHPYHARIRQELERRAATGMPTILVAMHSFTPCYMAQSRPWHAGVLYQRDKRLAAPLLALLRAREGLVVGDNEPYSVSDTTDYGVVQYGERLGHLHVELEVRQDLIAEEAGQCAWGELLAELLPRARALAE